MNTRTKFIIPVFFVFVIVSPFVFPAQAVTYTSGVTVGQYVKYGNFIGSGQGFEALNDYKYLELQVTSVSGNDVTLLSTGEFENGTALPGNGTTTLWNVETGTQDGIPATQGPIISANLNQGDAIPPANTYTINSTESRTYLGINRVVNVLSVYVSTPDYNTSLSYAYDKATGMLLEASTQTITQSEPTPITSSYSYSVIETNIFGQTPNPDNSQLVQYIIIGIIAVVVIIVALLILVFRSRK